jgi:hypothetical protein
MNINAKSSIKYLCMESNSTLRGSYTMIEQVSFQACKDGIAYAN